MPELNIKTVGGNGTFEEVIASATPEIQALTRDARALLANVMPGITEVPWARQKIAGYGVGPKKMSEHFCYLAPFKKHLNLGFFTAQTCPIHRACWKAPARICGISRSAARNNCSSPAVRALIEQASRHLPKLK